MEVTSAAARTFAAILEERTGQQLTGGHRWRLDTALQPLLAQFGCSSLETLAFKAAHGSGPETPALRVAVVEALLNHETSFFRDRAMFDGLRQRVLPALAADPAQRARLRIWSAGCATGQEAHSIAMLLDGEAERWRGWTIDIVATDVSSAAVARARSGLYRQMEAQRGLSVGEMLRYMMPDGADWRLRPDIVARSRFLVANLLDPPPLGRFDLVLCRNVLLYLGPTQRRQAFARLAEALAPGGRLILGAGETTLGQTDAIVPDLELRGCYRRVEGAGAGGAGGAMPSAA